MHLTSLLNNLAEDAGDRESRDFSVAVGLVNDLGRLIVGGPESDLRQAQAATSAVREQLSDEENMRRTPAEALVGWNSRSFLSGALWAVTEIMTTRLDAVPPVAGGGRATRKDRVKDLVLAAMASDEAQSPTTVLDSIVLRDSQTRPDEVSRALTEMLVAGLVDVVAPPSSTDRRMKYFALTPRGRAVAAERPELA
jgi:hypothetical protein